MTTPEAALGLILAGHCERDGRYTPPLTDEPSLMGPNEFAASILAALHDAGYAPTPLAPQVPRGRAVNASTSYDADGAAEISLRPPEPDMRLIDKISEGAEVPPEPDSGPQPDPEPMERCCTLTGCHCRYAPSQRGTGHDHARVGCRVPAPLTLNRLERGRDLTDAEISTYIADHQGPVRHGTADIGTEIAEQLRDRLAAAGRPDALRAAVARAIEGGYADESIDPGLYQNDPVYHAVVFEVRQHRPDSGDGAAPIDVGRLERALRPGHLFEHDGGIEDCPRLDGPAARAMAEDIAVAYARSGSPAPEGGE